MKKTLLLFFSLFLFACSSDNKEEGKEEINPPLKATPYYILAADLVRFVGNEGVPDFKFNEKFLREKKIKAISLTEKIIRNTAPDDTITTDPAMIWLIDSIGKVKELQLFNQLHNKVQTEYYILPEELPALAAKKDFDANNSAVTIYAYDKGALKLEVRTEPTNADTTKYFYSAGKIDSVNVIALSGKKVGVRFSYFKSGALQNRIVIESGNKVPVKDWDYIYDSDGNLKSIKEKNADGGTYYFQWDKEGKMIYSEYKLDKIGYKKTYTYDGNGFLEKVEVEFPAFKRILIFGYAK
jgi:hypothetical protein